MRILRFGALLMSGAVCCIAAQINAGGVVNAAASSVGKLARGGLATIYGDHFASAPTLAGSLPLPLILGGVSVTVSGIQAPLYYVDSGQINFQVPFEVAGSSANVAVSINGVLSSSASVAMGDYAVGVFSDPRTGDPAVVHSSDNSPVTAAKPALPSETLVVYVTGIGKLQNPPKTGAAAVSSPTASAVDSPSVTVAGTPATVLFAGLTPGAVGLGQINIILPPDLPSGSLPLAIQLPGDSSPLVNLAVKGNVPSPLVNLSTASLAFGNVTTGQSKDLTLTISNTGNAALAVSQLSVTGTGFSVVSPSTPFNVAAGGMQTVTVRFAPATDGTVSGTLAIATNAFAPPPSVGLSGMGLKPGVPAIGASPASLDFGTVTAGQTKDLTIAVSNTGTGFLTVSSLTASAGFSVVSPPAPFDVGAAASTTVTVRFAPVSSGGAPGSVTMVTGSLTIVSNDAAHPTTALPLTGNDIEVIPPACSFTLSAAIYIKWIALGGQTGLLGCPTADETEAAKSPFGTTGRVAAFARGFIYWHRDGAFAGQANEIHGCVVASYNSVGGSGGSFGFPVSDQYAVDGGVRSDFQGGYILGILGSADCPALGKGADFTAIWSTGVGFINLVQDSINVTGLFAPGIPLTGEIRANDSGVTLSAGFKDQNDNVGLLSVALSSDGSGISGGYQLNGSTTDVEGSRFPSTPTAWLTPERLDFGTVAVGQSKDLVFTAADVGALLLAVTSLSTDNPAFKTLPSQSTQFSVLPGGTSYPLTVRFTPTRTGPVSGSLIATTTDPIQPTVTLHLVGAGK